MSTYTHQTAPTQFIEINGITFAYRRFGKQVGIPLVFNPHILGNLDSWDPAVTDGLAQNREVILFDNAGIGKSTGEVPSTFGDMARTAGIFIDALGLTQVDVLGFSIGSMIAQNIALQRPDLVRKLVLVGSGPRNGDGIPLTTESQAIFTTQYGNLDDFWIDGFFTPSVASQAAGRAFLKRRDLRIEDRDKPISEKVQPAQFAALQEWGQPVGERFAYLRELKMPVLIVGGKSDIIFYTINSFYLQQNLPNAQLILYPDSAHGSLFQYPRLFVEHTDMFLRGQYLSDLVEADGPVVLDQTNGESRLDETVAASVRGIEETPEGLRIDVPSSRTIGDEGSPTKSVPSSYVERSGMSRDFINLIALVFLVLAGSVAFAQTLQQPQSPLMNGDKEFQLAIASGPPEIRESAGVFVLGEHGFVKVRDSRNGFNCIVERRARHLSPMCYDGVGSTNTLQATLMRGDLLMKGTDPVEIEKRIDEAYGDGHLHAPQKTGVVYMLSTEGDWHDQSSGGKTVHIVPHIMVYAPYLKNSDIAVAKAQLWKTNRVWIQYEGRPDAYLIFSVGSTWAQP